MEKKPLALVTGAAHRLGRTFAIKLARLGYAVLLHYHQSAAEMVLLEDEIRALGVPVHSFSADLTDPLQVNSLFSTLDSLNFQLRILVNSAAEMRRVNLKAVTVEDWDATLDLNLRAPFLLARESARRMIEGGLIVNITDAGAGRAWTGFPAYQASKAGLEVLTRILAKTYAPTIRVNAIAPGLVLPSEDISEQEWMKLVERVPLKRAVSMDDLADALEFLIRNSSITGQTIVVDSGYSII
jgi:NAD(P)-dependent dehydrogenase (short-subunit alcohol dehydrogenase family)